MPRAAATGSGPGRETRAGVLMTVPMRRSPASTTFRLLQDQSIHKHEPFRDQAALGVVGSPRGRVFATVLDSDGRPGLRTITVVAQRSQTT